jgi:ribose 5-phosphate isomerase A
MNLKQMAATKAVELVQSGMAIGLGTGSTTRYAIEMISQRLRDGALSQIVGVPTSSGSASLAQELGIPLTTLQEHRSLDLTIDGADEVGPGLVLIKGQGGALLREKIVAHASRREIIVVDEGKMVQILGTRTPLATEVVPFGWDTYSRALRCLGCEPVLRMRDGKPYVTDEGNYIVDCQFERIDDPAALEREINRIPGVVENGLFIDLASMVLVAFESGVVELLP